MITLCLSQQAVPLLAKGTFHLLNPSIMKATTFTLVLLLSCCQWLAAQCPTGDIIFSTQGQIDNFQLNYPGCTNILGNVTIQGTDITNLNGLLGIDSIGKNLYIQSNISLTSLGGLDSLISIGQRFRIEGNSVLTSLNGLGLLSSVGFSGSGGFPILITFTISDNPNLSSLDGMENLHHIKGAFEISNNTSLTSLTGLENLHTVCRGLTISNNSSLLSLNGLEYFSGSGCNFDANLTISDNASLINLTGLEAYAGTGSLIITNNFSLTSLFGFSPPNHINSLIIQNNPALASIESLANLASIHALVIENNSSLTSLSGLEQMDTIGNGFGFTDGYLTIKDNSSLTSLNGLEKLNYVGGCVTIENNSSLTSLNGLGMVSYIGRCGYSFDDGYVVKKGLQILNNSSLASLNGLENLSYVWGCLSIENNNVLTTLNGLGNLDSIGFCELSGQKLSLSSEGNSILSSLNGLESLTTIDGNITIIDNPALTSLNGLDSINEATIDSLIIQNCPNLSTCEVNSVCNFIENGGGAIISGNAPGCNNLPEVQLACGIVSAEGPRFKGNDAIQITPNPATDFINLHFPNPFYDTLQVRLFDSQGKLVNKQSITDGQAIEIGHLPNGIYLLKATNGKQVLTTKFIKQ